uniref:Uncharacterized protein n=1 Tax=Zea mays TaxID=4577 RepID=B6TBA4_MAIZE|nr:hypothetical protein [Zea mays]
MEVERRRLKEGRAWRCPCVRDARATPSKMLANHEIYLCSLLHFVRLCGAVFV